MSALHRITLDPNICAGRPSIRGLRIRVTDILELLAAGASQGEILKDYPFLEAADIAAAIEYDACRGGHSLPDVV